MSLGRTPLGATTSQIANIDYDGSNNPIYVGYAVPGTANSANTWLIFRYTWVLGNCTAIRVANGTLEYGDVWDNRVILPYS